MCVGLRGHTVWRHVVLHATAPVTALCAEVGQQQQQQPGHSHIMQGLPPPFAFAAASLCDVHLCDEVMCHMSLVNCHMPRVILEIVHSLILLTGTPSSSAHERHHHNSLSLLLQRSTARRCA